MRSTDRPRRAGRPRRKRRGLLVAAGAVLVEAGAIRRLGYPVAGDVVVRCRRGHVFTTIWVPGVSVKALRLGWLRFQRCPVGRHWTLVAPVRRSDLTPGEQRSAELNRDIRLP